MSKIEKTYTIVGNILTVRVEIEKRLYKEQERILLKTEDIQRAVTEETEYNITETIEECAGVSNGVKKKTILNHGTWVFKVKPLRKKTEKPTNKKQGTSNPSIKSRMSNIAKKASQNKEL
jgi:hypothetical protein